MVIGAIAVSKVAFAVYGVAAGFGFRGLIARLKNSVGAKFEAEVKAEVAKLQADAKADVSAVEKKL
jgi:hypothetical protein